MKTWILSIVLTSILVAIFSIILPKTKTGNLVKAIFQVILISVVIKPLLSFNFNYDDNSCFNSTNVQIQENFVLSVNAKKIDYLEENCQLILENNGISNSEISIYYINDENLNIQLEKVVVNLKNSVIISSDVNIDIVGRTKSIISKNLNIKEELVEVYV